MSEVRTRMIRDMALRGFSPRTHETYVAAVVRLAKYYKRAPDQLTNDEVQAYLAHLIQVRKLSWSTCSQAAHAFHTWGQNLSQHLHLHCVVTGGALAPDGSRWIPAPPGFLFPVRALAQVFRGQYLDALRRAFHAGTLVFAGSTAPLADPGAFAAWLNQLRQPDWVVYVKRPFAGPEQVLEYLGRYTHRVALSNECILSLEDGRVRFRWKDYGDGDRVKVMELEAAEFIRRFLLHVVPDSFVRIRHFGLLANRTRTAKLAQCRQVLAQPAAPAARPVESVHTLMLRLTGIDIDRCPVCQQGRVHVTAILPSAPRPSRRAPSWDTS